MEVDSIGINICILCKKECSEKQKLISEKDWLYLKNVAEKWKPLDKYNDVYDSVNWECCSTGQFWHSNCKREICGQRKLEQAITRKRKRDESDNMSQDLVELEVENRPSSSRESIATRQNIGIVHSKDLCIWCMKGEDKKNPNPLSFTRR